MYLDLNEHKYKNIDKKKLAFIEIIKLCEKNSAKLIYASSAATYGLGEFGYDDKKDFGMFETLLEEEDDWDDEYDYIDNEDNLISFLNEYYIVYPKKIPKPEFK
jgi:hypothetical protein